MRVSDHIRWRDLHASFVLEFDLPESIPEFVMCEIRTTVKLERPRVLTMARQQGDKSSREVIVIDLSGIEESPTFLLAEKLEVCKVIDRIIDSHKKESDSGSTEEDPG